MAEMGLRYEAAIQRGLSRFADETPGVRAAMASISEAEADAIGISLEEARDVELQRRLQEHVKHLGGDVAVFLLYQGAASDDELAELLAHRKRQIDRAIGL